jgi:hypothetical protein
MYCVLLLLFFKEVYQLLKMASFKEIGPCSFETTLCSRLVGCCFHTRRARTRNLTVSQRCWSKKVK